METFQEMLIVSKSIIKISIFGLNKGKGACAPSLRCLGYR
jgi:hypothetical protein